MHSGHESQLARKHAHLPKGGQALGGKACCLGPEKNTQYKGEGDSPAKQEKRARTSGEDSLRSAEKPRMRERTRKNEISQIGTESGFSFPVAGVVAV